MVTGADCGRCTDVAFSVGPGNLAEDGRRCIPQGDRERDEVSYLQELTDEEIARKLRALAAAHASDFYGWGDAAVMREAARRLSKKGKK